VFQSLLKFVCCCYYRHIYIYIISVDDLNTSITSKYSNTKKDIQRITNLLNKLSEDEPFVLVMKDYLKSIRSEFQVKIEDRYNRMLNELNAIATLYNEDSEQLRDKPGQFFKTIHSFIIQFNEAVDPNTSSIRNEMTSNNTDYPVEQQVQYDSDDSDHDETSDYGSITSRLKSTSNATKPSSEYNLAIVSRKKSSRGILQRPLSGSTTVTAAPPVLTIIEEKKDTDPYLITITSDNIVYNEQESIEKQERLCTELNMLKKNFVSTTRRFVYEGKLYSLHADVKKLLEYQAYLFNDCLLLKLITQGADIPPITIISLEDMHIKNTPKTTCKYYIVEHYLINISIYSL
jgi:hypothetical protein